MFGSGNTSLGLILALIGVALLVLTPLVLRFLPRKKARASENPVVAPFIHADIAPNQNAVILVQAGGRVVYLNEHARAMFGLSDGETPNLERMARHTRPADAFLGLCATAGEVRFNLQQSLVEGLSYYVPYQGQQAVLVTLTHPQLAGLDEGKSAISSHAITIFTEVSQSMTASLDLETTIQTILESIDRLVPSDFSEITLWDIENNYFIPYRYLTEDDGVRRLRKSSDFYTMDKGYSGYLASHNGVLMLEDVNLFNSARPAVQRQQFPILSFMGIPLKIGGKLIGTIELASQITQAFTQEDIEVLEILSGHAAIALQNAVTHHKEQERVREMTGLAELAQISRAAQNAQNLYEELVETISPLIGVDILGFLIYNEHSQTLEGQVPFRGFPAQFTELYRSEIGENKQAGEVWHEQDVIITDNMGEDSIMGRLGLAPLAQAADIRETVLMPLNAGGRPLGYLQVANKSDGSRFNEDDLRLLRIIAGQVAPILENANLIQQSRQRAQRAEVLRRIASLAGSEATLDETLKFSMIELGRFLQADCAMAFLLDENLGMLQIHESSAVGLTQNQASRISLHLITRANINNTVTSTGMALTSSDFLVDDDLPQPYKALQPMLEDIHSIMVAQLAIRGRGIGEIIIGSSHRNHFSRGDSQSLENAASQIANAIDRSFLLRQTDETLQRQVEELATLNRLSRQFNVVDGPEAILWKGYEEALRITKADSCGILLFDQDANGSTPIRITQRVGSTPPNLSGIDQQAFTRKETVYIPDLFDSSYARDSRGERSALIVPILQQGQPAGLVRLFSKKADHFDPTSQEIIQSLAAQMAVILANIRQYQRISSQSVVLSHQAKALDHLLETRKTISPEDALVDSLAKLCDAIHETAEFDVVVVYLYHPKNKTLRAAAITGIPPEDKALVQDMTYSWENLRNLTLPEFRQGRVYYIPADKAPNISPIIPDLVERNYTIPKDSETSWIPGDQLLLPLSAIDNQPLGLIVVDAPLDGTMPDKTKREILELFAAEAALVIENHQKVEQLKKHIEEVESKISLSEHAAQINQYQENLSVLLQKDLEQTIALQQLYQRARNIRVGLDIAETVNRQPDRQSVLTSLASQMLTEMELDIALVAEPSPGGPRLLGQFGPLPQGTNPQALLGQRNPLRQTLQSGETIFVPNLDESAEWQNTPLLKNLNTKGFISLPISSNGVVDAAVLAISNIPLGEITKEDEQVYVLIANQVSITLQNLQLLTETRRRLGEVNLLLDFSSQLGSLDPAEILSTLVNSIRRVLPHAHGVRILLWNKETQTLHTEAAAGYNENDTLAQISQHADDSLIGQAYQQGKTLNIKEVEFSKDFNLAPDDLLRYREATGGRLPVAVLIVPVKTGDDTLGVVELDNFNTAGAFTPEDIALIESLTQQIALALENARLYAESQRINEELEKRVTARTQELAREHQFTQTLLRISAELSSSLDLDMVLNLSLSMLNEATGSEQAAIMIVRPPEKNLICLAGAGIHESPATGGTVSSLSASEGLAGWVIKNQQAVTVPDLLKDKRWKEEHGINTIYRSILIAPLIVGQDALGCLILYHRQPDQFRQDQLDAIQAAANQFAVTINNGELFQLIRDQAEDLGNMLRAQQIETSRSNAMLEGVGDGVLVTDNVNIISLFNDAAEKMLGIDRSEILGKSLDDFVGLFGGAAQSWMDAIRGWSLETKEFSKDELYSERLSLEDGRVISVHLSPVSDRQEFLGTISIFRDITHQVEVDRLKSEFVATVSHELRTPMTPIKGYVEFLLMGGAGELSEQQNQFVQIIKTNIDRLSILVNDLLDVSRIEAGKVALSFQPINLNEVINESVQTILQQSSEDQHPVLIDVRAPDNLPSIYGDTERVRQILTNLVDNAYKYSPENSRITINVVEHASEIQVDIIDQGIGIFPDEQTKIFERFYRGENHLVMAAAGTGLGLSIVKELVEMHNGRIWVKSAGVPGEGSTFSFTLPLYYTDTGNK